MSSMGGRWGWSGEFLTGTPPTPWNGIFMINVQLPSDQLNKSSHWASSTGKYFCYHFTEWTASLHIFIAPKYGVCSFLSYIILYSHIHGDDVEQCVLKNHHVVNYSMQSNTMYFSQFRLLFKSLCILYLLIYLGFRCYFCIVSVTYLESVEPPISRQSWVELGCYDTEKHIPVLHFWMPWGRVLSSALSTPTW